MKKFYLGIFVVLFIFAAWLVSVRTSAQKRELAVSPHLVISQFQVAGGVHNDEFVELHNISASSVDLNGYRLVYRSSTGSNDVHMVAWTSNTVIPAGGFYLVGSDTYDGGGANATYTTATVSMSGTSGGLAIRNGALNTGVIIDSVGYGAATNGFVEGTATVTAAANASRVRSNNGCQDTDSNNSDFTGLNPSVPRSVSTTPILCNGGGTTLFAGMNGNPGIVYPGESTLLTVTVIPATTPPSTGVSVVGNLASIGGAGNQQFFDNGTNGDATPGDNVFSYQAFVPLGTSDGPHSVTAVASDAQARTANTGLVISVNGCPANDEPLAMGNPSGATSDVLNENNYLMVKRQFSLSYNRTRAIPNWTAWRLDSSWIGDTDRQDDFRPDNTLPAGWYQVLDTDYSGSGYQRGHMTPSGDRTCSVPDNSATFLMTNMIPQFGPNNEGPWNDLENYLRTLTSQGKELYIISGGQGNFGTIAQGRIVVPDKTWKVVLVLNNGANDLSRVNKSTRVFGVIMPNHAPLTQGQQWRTYRVTVDAVEHLTGYDFFSNVPINTQMLIERHRDRL